LGLSADIVRVRKSRALKKVIGCIDEMKRIARQYHKTWDGQV
jgi:hypothetical protein